LLDTYWNTFILLNLHEPVPTVPQKHGASVHWDSFSISVSCIETPNWQCRIYKSTMVAATDSNVQSDQPVMTGSTDRNI